MAETDNDETNMTEAFFTFVKAMRRRGERTKALKGVGLLMVKFALPCLAVVALVAAGQIRGAGFTGAWERFGVWWILWTVAGGMLPVMFVLCAAALEAAVSVFILIVVLAFHGLPSLLVGEERADKIFSYAGKLPLVGLVGLVVWVAWTGGRESTAPGHAQHIPPVSHNTVSFAWVGSLWHWAITNPVPVTLGGLVLVPLISEIVKKFGAAFAEEIVNREPKRIVKIYDPQGSVVREVVLED